MSSVPKRVRIADSTTKQKLFLALGVIASVLIFGAGPELLSDRSSSLRLLYAGTTAAGLGVVMFMTARRVARKDGARPVVVWVAMSVRWIGMSCVAAGVANHELMHESDGAAWAATYSAGFLLLGIGHAIEAMNDSDLFGSILMVFFFVTAFNRALSGDHDPEPAYLLVLGGLALVMAILTLPLLVSTWQRTQDERQRLIVTSATSMSFVATVLALCVFVALERFGSDVEITATWILLVAGVTWAASWFVLRERM